MTNFKFKVPYCFFKPSDWQFTVLNFGYKVLNCDFKVDYCGCKPFDCDFKVFYCDFRIPYCTFKPSYCDLKADYCGYKAAYCDFKVPNCENSSNDWFSIFQPIFLSCFSFQAHNSNLSVLATLWAVNNCAFALTKRHAKTNPHKRTFQKTLPSQKLNSPLPPSHQLSDLLSLGWHTFYWQDRQHHFL